MRNNKFCKSIEKRQNFSSLVKLKTSFLNFINNKKGILAGTLVTVVVLAIVFVVLLRFNGAIIAILRGLGEDYLGCLSIKVMSAYTKTPILGTVVWGAFCKPVVKTVTMLDGGETTLSINSPLRKKELENVKEWYKGKNYDFEKENIYLKYRLDQTIANEMKRCWGRNGQGKLPLGQEWNKWFFDTDEGILYCDLCAVISFDEQVQDKFNPEGRMSIKEYLQKNPVRWGSTENLWVHLKDEDFSSDFRDIGYSTEEDLEVVYTRSNVNKFNEMFRDTFADPFWFYGEEDHPVPMDAVLLVTRDQFLGMKCNT